MQEAWILYVLNAVKAKELFQLGEEYIIRDGKVSIVDTFTGRVLEGRRWSDGMHQAGKTWVKLTGPSFYILGNMLYIRMSHAKVHLYRFYRVSIEMITYNMTYRVIKYDIYRYDQICMI